MAAILTLPLELSSQILTYLSQADRMRLLLVSKPFYGHFKNSLYERIDLYWNDPHAWGCQYESRACECDDELFDSLPDDLGQLSNPRIAALMATLLRQSELRSVVRHLSLTGTPHRETESCCEAQDVLAMGAATTVLAVLDSGLKKRIIDGLIEDRNVAAAAALLVHILLPFLSSLGLSQDFQHKFPLPMLVLQDAVLRGTIKLSRLDLCADQPRLAADVHIIPRWSRNSKKLGFGSDRDAFNRRTWIDEDPETDAISVLCIPTLTHFSCIMYSTPDISPPQRMLYPVMSPLTSLSIKYSHISESDLEGILCNTPSLKHLLFDCWWPAVAPQFPEGDWKEAVNPLSGEKLLKALTHVKATIQSLVILAYPYMSVEDNRDEVKDWIHKECTIEPINSLGDFIRLQRLQIPLCLLLPWAKDGLQQARQVPSIAKRMPKNLDQLCLTDDGWLNRLRDHNRVTDVDPIFDELISDLKMGDEFPPGVVRLQVAITIDPDPSPCYDRIAGFEDAAVHGQLTSLEHVCWSMCLGLELLENPARPHPIDAEHALFGEWTMPTTPKQPFCPKSYDPAWRRAHEGWWADLKIEMQEREAYRARTAERMRAWAAGDLDFA